MEGLSAGNFTEVVEMAATVAMRLVHGILKIRKMEDDESQWRSQPEGLVMLCKYFRVHGP